MKTTQTISSYYPYTNVLVTYDSDDNTLQFKLSDTRTFTIKNVLTDHMFNGSTQYLDELIFDEFESNFEKHFIHSIVREYFFNYDYSATQLYTRKFVHQHTFSNTHEAYLFYELPYGFVSDFYENVQNPVIKMYEIFHTSYDFFGQIVKFNIFSSCHPSDKESVEKLVKMFHKFYTVDYQGIKDLTDNHIIDRDDLSEIFLTSGFVDYYLTLDKDFRKCFNLNTYVKLYLDFKSSVKSNVSYDDVVEIVKFVIKTLYIISKAHLLPYKDFVTVNQYTENMLQTFMDKKDEVHNTFMYVLEKYSETLIDKAF